MIAKVYFSTELRKFSASKVPLQYTVHPHLVSKSASNLERLDVLAVHRTSGSEVVELVEGTVGPVNQEHLRVLPVINVLLLD